MSRSPFRFRKPLPRRPVPHFTSPCKSRRLHPGALNQSVSPVSTTRIGNPPARPSIH